MSHPTHENDEPTPNPETSQPDDPPSDEPELEEIASRLLIGDAESVAERLATERDVLGLTHMSCFMAIPGLDQRDIMKSIEAFGSKVIPLVGKQVGPSGPASGKGLSDARAA